MFKVLVSIICDGFRAIWASWLIWPAAIVFVGLRDYVLVYRSGNPAIGCLQVVAGLVAAASQAWLVLVVPGIKQGSVPRSNEVWPVLRRNFWRMVGAGITVELGVILLALGIWLFMAITQLEIPPAIARSLNLLVVVPLLTGVATFAVCAVMISNLSPLHAAWDALLIATNSLVQLALITLLFLLLRCAALVAVMSVAGRPDWPDHVMSLAQVDPGVWLAEDRLPLAWIVGATLTLLISTAELSVYIHAYLAAIARMRYPWMDLKDA